MKNDYYIQELVKLIAENPDLPVVSLVDSEIIPDYEYGFYMGKISCSFVDYCGLVGDRICVGEDDYKEEFYDAHEIDFEGLSNKEIEKRLDKAFNKNCKKAIVVYINPCDTLDF